MAVIAGDCLNVMRDLPDGYATAVVTDPPYGLEFMGKDWDAVLPPPEVWREALRVLRPGGHVLIFGGTRTYHRLACAVEDAGFEIRDCLMWLYGQGFPKSKNLDGDWSGYGTALKPAWEPIILARKPLAGTVAANALAHGTGALNIDGTRIGTDGGGTHCSNRDEQGKCRGHKNAGRSTSGETFHGPETEGGRWPANLVLDDEAAMQLGEESRFFYCAKASRSDRGDGNTHPTVKPVELMRWLVRLVRGPVENLVLDPFAGSGTTGVACALEGVPFLLIEREAAYVEIIERRLAGIPS